MRSTLPGLQHRHRLRDREVGLAGAGGADRRRPSRGRRAAPYRSPDRRCAGRPRRGACGSPAGPTAAGADRHRRRPAGSRPPPRPCRRSRPVRAAATAPPAPPGRHRRAPASPAIATRLPRHDTRTPSACSMRTRWRSWSPSSSGSSMLSLKCSVTAFPSVRLAGVVGRVMAWLKRGEYSFSRVPDRELGSAAAICTGKSAPISVRRSGDMDRVEIGRASGDLAGMASRPGEQHRQGPPDAALELNARLLIAEQRLQLLKPPVLLGLRRPGRARRGGRAGARRVFEAEGLGEADLAHEREGGREIGVGLARMADDEVRRKRDVGPRRAQPFDESQVVGRAMARGSSPPASDRSPTAPAGAGTASAPAGRGARRSASRPCRADGRWCSAAAAGPGSRPARAAGWPRLQAAPSGPSPCQALTFWPSSVISRAPCATSRRASAMHRARPGGSARRRACRARRRSCRTCRSPPGWSGTR